MPDMDNSRKLPDPLSEEMLANTLDVTRLRERVLDPEVREAVSVFQRLCDLVTDAIISAGTALLPSAQTEAASIRTNPAPSDHRLPTLRPTHLQV